MAEIVIRNRVRRLSFDNGEMTKEELARGSSCTRQKINTIEAAKVGPSLELAFKIAQVSGAGIEDVFQYAVVPHAPGESGRVPPGG